MAVIKQGGANPNAGLTTTTMGLKQRRGERCRRCGQFSNENMTISPNGDIICVECASPKERIVLTGCDPENCSCGQELDAE